MNNDNENKFDLDEILTEKEDATFNTQMNTHIVKAEKKPSNNILITIICCLLSVCITLIVVYLFNPNAFTKVENNPNKIVTENGNDNFFGKNDKDGMQRTPNKGGKGGNEGKGDTLVRRDANGNKEYSTDGGKTWSSTPPDNMPDDFK